MISAIVAMHANEKILTVRFYADIAADAVRPVKIADAT
jgi:hypothetical protein